MIDHLNDGALKSLPDDAPDTHPKVVELRDVYTAEHQ